MNRIGSVGASRLVQVGLALILAGGVCILGNVSNANAEPSQQPRSIQSLTSSSSLSLQQANSLANSETVSRPSWLINCLASPATACFGSSSSQVELPSNKRVHTDSLAKLPTQGNFNEQSISHETGTTLPEFETSYVDPTTQDNTSYQATTCISATSCIAVGVLEYLGNSENLFPIVSFGNQGNWTTENTPISQLKAVLEGVACPTSQLCIAVGGSSQGGVIEDINMQTKAYSVDTSMSGSLANINLMSISCPSATFCDAVGNSATNIAPSGSPAQYTFQPTSIFWDGSKWSIGAPLDEPATAPVYGGGNLAPNSFQLSSISCTSATFCTSVGTYQGQLDLYCPSLQPPTYAGVGPCEFIPESSPPIQALMQFSEPLVETFNGTSWTMDQSFQVPTAPQDAGNYPTQPNQFFEMWYGGGYLSSVSCVSVDLAGPHLSVHPIC